MPGDFLGFLQAIVDGTATVEQWNRFAVTRYDDPRLEAARSQLVAESLSIGQCSARPFPPALQAVAESLLDELRG